jgi:hypothetical protein
MSEQPSVYGFYVVLGRVVAFGLEFVRVKNRHLAVVPAGANRFLALAQHDLNVCYVVSLLFHF